MRTFAAGAASTRGGGSPEVLGVTQEVRDFSVAGGYPDWVSNPGPEDGLVVRMPKGSGALEVLAELGFFSRIAVDGSSVHYCGSEGRALELAR